MNIKSTERRNLIYIHAVVVCEVQRVVTSVSDEHIASVCEVLAPLSG